MSLEPGIRLIKQLAVALLTVLALVLSLSAAQSIPQAPRRLFPDGYVKAQGAATDSTTGLPKRILHAASGVTLVLIPAGGFFMGSPPGEAERMGDEDRHRRIIHQPFHLGETEVTVAQFRRFVAATNYQTDAEAGTPLDAHRVGSFAAVPHGDRAWSLLANWRNPFPNLREYRRRDEHPVVHVSWNDAQRFLRTLQLSIADRSAMGIRGARRESSQLFLERPGGRRRGFRQCK